MKKLILAITLSSAFGLANAQEMLSKKGTPILPEAKDWSIGFDAKPIFNYFGNMFNNSVNDSLYAGFQHPFIIVGKYMKDENTAYRAMFRIGYTTVTDNAFIADQNSQVSPPALVTDSRTTTQMNIALGLGKQKYRGKGRLKGYYGYEAQLLLMTQKQSFDYGNALDPTYPISTSNTTDFGSLFGDTLNISNLDVANQVRVTEAKVGTMFGIGVRGYLGIEYFFAPKFSIGAEYGWGLSLLSQGKGDLKYEGISGSSVGSANEETGKNSAFSIDTDNLSGGIFLSAYF